MTPPDMRKPEALWAHMRHTLAFYAPRVMDPSGGCFQFFKDDGAVYDRRTRHLVSSTRFVFNHALAWRWFGGAVGDVAHALAFVREAHAQPQGGYAWVLDWQDGRASVVDGSNHCYGLAFVLLAHAHAAEAGVPGAREGIATAFALMEQRFWEPAHGLYADEATPDWQLAPYRGQNANMHACEAMLAAHAATGKADYLDRALTLATAIARRQAALAGGLVWEHYKTDWTSDWDYNRDDRTNIFRPWGFQTGHLTEWAKLLLMLERRLGDAAPDWLLPTARRFFDTAMKHGWDATHGGLVYGFAPGGAVCDGDKYFWVQAESLAAAAWLAVRTGDAGYWQWYDRLWAYAWQHFVDHEHGAWYRILGNNNTKLSDEKSPAGKTDYHTMGACQDVLAALGVQPPARGIA
ncbi:AGE family epimerase/isomerase [Roseateles saccharophilus]|uniref:Mannose/cellobiose epimerase-like protein (N-acyl-D-glucosamine 2-epimerase family) n=1 Tax=Roseateles saccharophilus TaxID=304 RepID=A0A4R3URJ9_ROSSA|nr:AGE family epimerase/isomerase [Roseateles saccharophilus]MDG0833690.1 AGE family epimerase/isomerase [Roseateles saccharophilus]TCU93277.1 mannose/cellobiose epimerase-like protein (N-acyl-D-glucosamine 2-epimerase family) [Roseateles saccharophilus]